MIDLVFKGDNLILRYFLSFLEIVIVIIMITILEILLYNVPYEFLKMITSNINIIGIDTLYDIIYEVLVNVSIIFILVKYFRIKDLNISNKINNGNLMLFTTLIIFGYNNIYSNSVGLLMNTIEISPRLTESFEGLIQSPIYALISLCIFAPVFEEIIYRGIILNVLLQKFNTLFGVILSSMIFALVHFNLHQGVNALVVGLLLAFIYVKTRSIRLCIYAHFFNNFYVLLEGYFAIEIINFNIGRLIIGIGALIIGISGFYYSNINRYINKKISSYS